ncbi:hypothetical protein [Enterococcus sp. AZ109]
MLLSTIFGLIYVAFGALILYGIIRLAVRHGIQDAEKAKNR